jgi:DNA gyrase subunit A
MAIRFDESDARPMGRNTSGVKGITLSETDEVVGMVVVEPEGTLLTVCRTRLRQADHLSGAKTTAEGEEDTSSSNRYRTQRRGGKGIRDIKTTERNGKVVGIVPVGNDDQILLMTTRGKLPTTCLPRYQVESVEIPKACEYIRMDDGDMLAAVVKVPARRGRGNGSSQIRSDR